MTDQRLHDLLHETVSDVTASDLADAAWRSGLRARRRRTAALASGATAVVVGIAGTVALVDRGTAAHGPATGPSSTHPATTPPTATASPDVPGGATPDATVAGARVWWGPTVAQEADLPVWSSLVPPHIDLAADAPDFTRHPMAQAVAAFAVVGDRGLDRLVLVAPDASLRTLDVSRLGRVSKANGYRVLPETQSMLSPTGQYLMFPQDGSVEVFTLRTGRWSSVATGTLQTADATWQSDDSFFLPQHGARARGPAFDVHGRSSGVWALGDLVSSTGLGPVEWFGRLRMGPLGSAQSGFLSGRVPVRPGDVENGQGLVVQEEAGRRDVLVYGDPGGGTRCKACEPFVGWQDARTAVYESVGTPSRVVGWRVGTHDFGLLSTIDGLATGTFSYISSWARLWRFQPLS
jgi:hypothetical protein